MDLIAAAERFSSLSDQIRELKDVGVTPIITLARAPRWATPTDDGCGQLYPDAFDDVEELGRAMGTALDGDGDYDDDGTVDGEPFELLEYIDLWNEADWAPSNTVQDYHHGGCWGDDPVGYAKMMRRFYKGIKSTNPDVVVAMSGMAYDRFTSSSAPPGYPSGWYGPFNYGFVEDVFSYLVTNYATEPEFPFTDAANVHIYNAYRDFWDGPTQPYNQEMAGKVKTLQDRLAALGVPELPIMVTEVGIPSSPENQWVKFTEEWQAAYTAQTLVRGEALGLMANIVFTLSDFDHELGYKYGLLTESLVPKGAYTAFATMAEQLDGWEFDQQVVFADNQVEAYRFTLGGDAKIAAWADNGQPMGVKVGGALVPMVTTNITVSASHFPGVPWTGRLQKTDMYGNASSLGSGGAASVDVPLNEQPVLIEVAP